MDTAPNDYGSKQYLCTLFTCKWFDSYHTGPCEDTRLHYCGKGNQHDQHEIIDEGIKKVCIGGRPTFEMPMLLPETAQRQPASHRQDWLDVMHRIQSVRDELNGKLDTIQRTLNALVSNRDGDSQESPSPQGSVVPDEHGNTDDGETQLEFALRTESEVRQAAWGARTRATPTEPPRGYPHDIG